MLRIDALSIVSKPHAKLACTVGDFRFDVIGVCVTEGVAQRFARNAVDVVADDRMQVARRAFDRDRNITAPSRHRARIELFGQRGDRLRQFVAHDRRRSQILNRVAAFDDGLIRPIESAVERLDGFPRVGGQQVARTLEADISP